MTNSDDQQLWADYYQKLDGRPPRETVLKALELFAQEHIPSEKRTAVDLGCGAGQDTFELLRHGWSVLAMDKQPEAIQRIQSKLPPEIQPQLNTKVASFEALTNLPNAMLINASFSLPFCHPDHFDTLWTLIEQAIAANGRFAGNLFGDKDSWTNNPNMTFHSRSQAEALFTNFDMEFFAENDEDGTTALGKEKHWHIFTIVARKRP